MEKISNIIPEGSMKDNYISAHKNYLPIDKTSRKLHPTNEEITNFPQQAKTFQKAYKKLTFAEPNNQMHQLPEHSFHYLNMPQLKSIGKLSTEGNEAGNRRFKNEKKLHTFTGSIQSQMEQSIRFEWMATCPLVLNSLEVNTRKQTCGRCGSLTHNRTNRVCPLYDS